MMKTIDLSRVYDLRRTVRYSVSPLFEMALSLHLACQPTPPTDPWVARMRESLVREGLEGERRYFAPVFFRGVPAMFSPQATERLYETDGPIQYVVSMAPAPFVQAVTMAMGPNAAREPLAQDVRRSPLLVKGRFTLFVSSYLRLVFQPVWQELLPAFHGEIEQRNRIMSTYEDVGTFVTHLLSQPLPDSAAGSSVVLHPSWFYRGVPYTAESGKAIHVVYPLAR